MSRADKQYPFHQVWAFDGAPANLLVRTPGTNKPTDRNHLMRYGDHMKTVCGLRRGADWRVGILGRRFCIKCLGLIKSSDHQTWTDGSYPRSEED